MLKIKKVISGSPVDSSKILPGDELAKINGQPVNDIIDYRFLQAESKVKLIIKRGNRKLSVSITKDIDTHLGLEFYPDRIIRCRNKCVFCFCHNNPKSLRHSLYVKDDDYRQSFLHGNFITLTNLSDDDLNRIISLRLSPLYISVQATDENTRRRLFDRKHLPPIMPILDKLARNKIYFHCQVVIVPGYNDGEIMKKTANDLASLQPYAASLAIVPVGLTNYSNPALKPVGPKRSTDLITQTGHFRKKYGIKGNQFAYAADELFINAGIDIPSSSYYDEFPQIENGIGMVRDFLNTFSGKLPDKIRGYWITGRSMWKVWRQHVLPRKNIRIKLVPVANSLFGTRVTVTGLLSGKDIINKLKSKKLKNEPIIIPPNCLNSDGLFLDNLTVNDIKDELGVEVILGSYNFSESLRRVS